MAREGEAVGAIELDELPGGVALQQQGRNDRAIVDCVLHALVVAVPALLEAIPCRAAMGIGAIINDASKVDDLERGIEVGNAPSMPGEWSTCARSAAFACSGKSLALNAVSVECVAVMSDRRDVSVRVLTACQGDGLDLAGCLDGDELRTVHVAGDQAVGLDLGLAHRVLQVRGLSVTIPRLMDTWQAGDVGSRVWRAS